MFVCPNKDYFALSLHSEDFLKTEDTGNRLLKPKQRTKGVCTNCGPNE